MNPFNVIALAMTRKLLNFGNPGPGKTHIGPMRSGRLNASSVF
jgi:hypothetical protein